MSMIYEESFILWRNLCQGWLELDKEVSSPKFRDGVFILTVNKINDWAYKSSDNNIFLWDC